MTSGWNCRPTACRPIAVGLVGEICPANREELGAFGKIESVGMPLVDRAWELGRAQPLAGRCGLPDRVVADLAALVVVTEYPRAERAGQHLRAKAEAQQRFVLGERHADFLPGRKPVGWFLWKHDKPVVAALTTVASNGLYVASNSDPSTPNKSCGTNCGYFSTDTNASIAASPLMHVPSQGVVNWNFVSLNLTADAKTDLLSFLAWGDNGNTTNLPPIGSSSRESIRRGGWAPPLQSRRPVC